MSFLDNLSSCRPLFGDMVEVLHADLDAACLVLGQNGAVGGGFCLFDMMVLGMFQDVLKGLFGTHMFFFLF